jgi:hypothetical protein
MPMIGRPGTILWVPLHPELRPMTDQIEGAALPTTTGFAGLVVRQVPRRSPPPAAPIETQFIV